MHPANKDNAKRTVLLRAFERGKAAREAGIPQAQCPYLPGGPQLRRDLRVAWLDGWGYYTGAELDSTG